MKKGIVFLVALALSVTVEATPIKGGYLGHRIIITAEGSYMPNYSKLTDLFMSYNMQYGGNIHFITGRYTEVGFSYNMYSMGAHHRYDELYSNNGRIKGYQAGITWRKFRVKRGGLAPIGKFMDVNLYYHADEYNVVYEDYETFAPVILKSSGLSGSIGFGTQGVYWGRVVGNCGVRFGGPIITLSEEGSPYGFGDEGGYMKKRMAYKDFFSVFFGVGIIL